MTIVAPFGASSPSWVEGSFEEAASRDGATPTARGRIYIRGMPHNGGSYPGRAAARSAAAQSEIKVSSSQQPGPRICSAAQRKPAALRSVRGT